MEKKNNYWVGVISGMCAASIFFACMMFVQVEQANKLRAEVAELKEIREDRDCEIYGEYHCPPSKCRYFLATELARRNKEIKEND